MGVRITDHKFQETLQITDRAYLTFEGSILKAGSAEELANDEQVRRVDLGQNFELRKTTNTNDNNPLDDAIDIISEMGD